MIDLTSKSLVVAVLNLGLTLAAGSAFAGEKPPPSTKEIEGRMTGGGSVFDANGLVVTTSGGTDHRVTHGFELYCPETAGPNNLQVNWDGNSCHLETLVDAQCVNAPGIEEPPGAGFDTYIGSGFCRFNAAGVQGPGVSGYCIDWTFVDHGEPGTEDTAEILIREPGCGAEVLSVSGNLNKGNHQAHKLTGNK